MGGNSCENIFEKEGGHEEILPSHGQLLARLDDLGLHICGRNPILLHRA